MDPMLADYLLFLAKILTVLAAIGALIAVAARAAHRGAAPPGLTVERLNDRFEQMALVLKRAVLGKGEWKQALKQSRARAKARAAGKDRPRGRVFVLDFKGDLRASATAGLREEVSAILAVAGEGDEVLLRLENAGGTVHEHGLAASQLERLKAAGLKLTVAVDKVAASGGYLMAAVADRILAAPFAIVGSIGVLTQLPNFHRWLEARGVDFEQITAGKYKRTLTLFAENTEEGRRKRREQMEEAHALFKDSIARHRGSVDMEAVATGEAFFGRRALELKLVDELRTSDDYLMEAARERDLLRVKYRFRRRLMERLAAQARALSAGAVDALVERDRDGRLFP